MRNASPGTSAGGPWCVLAPFPTRPTLRDDEVHVVQLHRGTAGTLIRQADVLDNEERERVAGFIRERDRERYVAARLLLRLVVGYCVDRPPHSLQFTTNAFGKPSLVDPPNSVCFNLSHAGELVLLAIARNREVGVDVEAERPLDVLTRSGRFFSRGEHEALQLLPAAERRAAFFRCWTRKESFVKALGLGLSFPWTGFDVSVDDGYDLQVLRACPAAPDQLARWRIMPLPIDSGYAASVTAERHDWRLVRWREPASLRATA
jgi:4'-phosphopantetheinyl transferase